MRICVQRLALVGIALTVIACWNGLLAGYAQAEGACPNEQLRAEQAYAPGLPDCRAYELVSPPDKNDNNILTGNVRASVSGEAVVYGSPGSFAEPSTQPAGSLVENRYVGRRGTNGWSTQSIDEPFTPYELSLTAPYEELIFTPELSKGALSVPISPPLTADALTGYPNLYIGDIAKGSYQALTTTVPTIVLGNEPPHEEDPYATPSYPPSFGGASTDLSRIVFQQFGSLTTGASPGLVHEYEWMDGQLNLIDIPPEGITFKGQDSIGAPYQLDIGLFPGDAWHAVSADGSRVFFTGGEPGVYIFKGNGREEEGAGQLYVREVDAAKTIEVSASQRASLDPNGPQAARFWDASSTGSKVFFTSKAELTENAYTGSSDNAMNLYEYNVEDGVLNDLTVDSNAGDVDGAAVLGLVTASEDGSYVYFVAEGNLAGAASSGKPNLYLYHGGKVTYIATLVNGDGTLVNGNATGTTGDEQDWSREDRYETEGVGGPGTHNVRVTPDGTRLAFVSQASLTGYDNEPVEPGECENESKRCSEVYLFDVATGLTCVSCNPSGAQPVGPSTLGGHEHAAEALFSSESSQFYLQRNLSEDGNRLFFQSRDVLLPHASNGRQNVYEYENGHVYLLSNGAGNYDSYFLDASPNGNNMFIATADQLLGQDGDRYVDLYDVRIGGGQPVASDVPACDNGDSCKPPVSARPAVFGVPASATFSGAGNIASQPPVKPVTKSKAKLRRCKKGFARKHGRCVKQRGKQSAAKRRGKR